MVKRMKVAVCDACGRVGTLVTRYNFEFGSWKGIPYGWVYRTKKELLCGQCAEAYERFLDEVKRGETDD